MPPVEIKICGKCGMEKPLDEFGFRYPKPGIRHSLCKSCFVEYKRVWYERNGDRHRAHVKERRALAEDENQRRVWEYLATHPCVDCGERDPVVLHFDHQRDKRRDVSFMCSSGWAWSTIVEEIAKCEVRCANCHARKTARDRGMYERKHMVLHTTRLPETDVLHNCDVRAVSSVD